MRFFALSLLLNLLLLALPLRIEFATAMPQEERLKVAINFTQPAREEAAAQPREQMDENPPFPQIGPSTHEEVAVPAEKFEQVEKIEQVAEKIEQPVKNQPEKKPIKQQKKPVKKPAKKQPVKKPAKKPQPKKQPSEQPAKTTTAPTAATAQNLAQPPGGQMAVRGKKSSATTAAQNPAQTAASRESFCLQHVRCEPLSEVYPRKAKQLGLFGRYSVLLRWSVGPSGEIINASATALPQKQKGAMIFRTAALNELRKRRCKLLHERAAGCEFAQTIVYELKK